MANLGNLKRLLLKSKQIKAKLTEIEAFLKGIVADTNPREIKNRIDDMYKIREEFESNSFEIVCCESEMSDEEAGAAPGGSDTNRLEMAEFGKLWHTVLSQLQTLSEQNIPVTPKNGDSPVNSGPNMTSPTPQFNVRLPVINLPVFSGTHTEWLPFYDAFLSLIHNNHSLDDCQKFHYLKSCLKGEAARAVESLCISSDNYQSAWSVLQKRYKNTRLIIQGHVQAILGSPEIHKCSADSLQRLIDDVTNNLEALKVQKIPVSAWDAMLVTMIMNKLDYQTRREFENTLNSEPLPLTSLIDFLEKKRIVLESLNQNARQTQYGKRNHADMSFNGTSKAPNNRSSNAAVAKLACYFCKKSHSVTQCEELLSLSTGERITEIKKRNLCLNCLRPNHKVSDCKASGCRTCQSRHHHTLLHDSKPVVVPQSPQTSANHCSALPRTHVVLSTAVVLVKDAAGKFQKCRSLLDVGSQINIISEAMCELLSLKTRKTNISIAGISGNCSKTMKMAKLTLKSLHHPFKTDIDCCILGTVTTNLPTETFDRTAVQIPDNVELADPKFNESGPIDLLLGADTFWSLLCIGRIKLSSPNLYLSKTLLGWIVGGAFSNTDQGVSTSCNIVVRRKPKDDLGELLERFWVQEEIVPSQNNWSAEEIECEEHFVNTHTRDPNDGRFVVGLPFKSDVSLGDSSRNALRRFLSLERKFRKDVEYKQTYCKAINELLERGYLEEVGLQEIDDNVFYLPHSGVFKNDPGNPKIRIVYDGSAKSSNGLSLNDNLMTGPNLQNDAFAILIRFRTHQVVVSCDMEKMFLQIKIDPKDTKFQLIYWRFGENEPIRVFKLTRLVFGLTNSPYTAIRCVRQLASDVKNEFPAVSRVLENDRFTDDILTGSENIQGGLELRNKLIKVLDRGGFPLAKWSSNMAEILPNSSVSDPANLVDLNKGESSKVLGLWWNPSEDTLNYRVQTPSSSGDLTKRSILSSIAKIYDPIGLISPVLIKAKIIMQKLWSLTLDWDDPVPESIIIEWTKFLNELEYLKEIKILRKIIPNPNEETDLIVFCDASLLAYGAAVYVRTKVDNNSYSTNLVCSKSRVSPLKVLTLPRLELCAALLGARLMDLVSRELNLKINKRYFFTDSMIVLHYLNANANTWQVFVANRVAKIQELSSIEDWYHVESKSNPADIVSRGAYPRQMNSNLYWKGPEFLTKNVAEWPEARFKPSGEVESLPEKRKIALATLIRPELPLLTNYSSFRKLQRVMAYCLRFVHNSQNKNDKRTGFLSTEELKEAHDSIMRLIQQAEFSEDYHALKHNQPVSSNSKLYSLDPFMDQNKIIRLGGRLRNAPLNFDRRFPILLPTKHHVTRSLMREKHVSLLHAGATQTLAALRIRYWPLRARNEIRKVIHSCVNCFRVSPRLTEQKMGDLPRDRLAICRPFLKVGLDYFGPVYLKQGGKRSTKVTKAWVALFVCLVTKAIHLEIVGDLTTECFLNALKRLISRRGKISHIYCDNAQTFVGAKRELDQILEFLKGEYLEINMQTFLLAENIVWKFIPPRSPNFGGLWERLVRSAKQHLKRVVMNANLTYEEAITLMAQIEAIVNSRPLTPLSNDPSDLQILTPAHFLIGESLSDLPEHNVSEIQESRLSRWERVQKLKQHFWKRWSREVLAQLQPKPKWCRPTPALHPGSLVLIAEDNLPPMKWRVGRIEQVFPGPDGLIRVASVRTHQGVYTRSVRKLAVLPIDEQ